MRRSIPGLIEKACWETFAEHAEVVVPRLIAELETPQRVGARLGVTSTAARNWLTSRGWWFDPETKAWTAPEPEAEHASL